MNTTLLESYFKTDLKLSYNELSYKMVPAMYRFPTRMHVCPAKTQISLSRCAGQSVLALRLKMLLITDHP